MSDPLHAGSNPTCIVGLGASAGGIEALHTFLEAMPRGTGLAFVIVQHLAPDHESLMVELLARHTAMTVLWAGEGVTVAADTVYVMPPGKNLRIFHGRLLLSDPEHQERGTSLPIDIFFRSLAEDQGERAVGVVLSGAGSDGSRGIMAIKSAGGMVLVQTDVTARFDGMPRAAMATGQADVVIPVEEMPSRLVTFASRTTPTATAGPPDPTVSGDRLASILSLLQERTHIDFSYYKPNIIGRRIRRRMALHELDEFDDYLDLMVRRHDEVLALRRELLIGVTGFYRDHEAWDELADKHLAAVFENSGSKEVRMWVAGCSTGEEAYTLALECSDWMERYDQRYDLKIFATDIDRDAIDHAGVGRYAETIAADLSPRLIEKYFSRLGDQYQIIRSLREAVVFAPHNLVADPPFTNLDLVICRNVLIYMEPEIQQQVLKSFKFALNAGGLLMLGTSETTGDLSGHFETLDSRFKIFRSHNRWQSVVKGQPGHSDPRWTAAPRSSPDGPGLPVREDKRLTDRILETLARGHIPPAVVVNRHLRILHNLGDTEALLVLPRGTLTNDITQLSPPELATPLAAGLHELFTSGEDVLYSAVHIRQEGRELVLDLRMCLLAGHRTEEPLALICFQRRDDLDSPAPTGDEEDYDAAAVREQRIRHLEEALQSSREHDLTTTVELESANEELQATNEEFVASNAELYGANEDLKAVVVELQTINAEHQQKLLELDELRTDLDNLLGGSRLYTLFLDEHLAVRKFTPDVDAVFPLIPSDVGRSFADLSHRLQDQDPLEIVREVTATGTPREVEVQTVDGFWFLMRVLPYRTPEGNTSGLVLALVDITGIKDAHRKLHASERRFSGLFEERDGGLIYQDTTGRVIAANQVAQQILGRPLAQLVGPADQHPDWGLIHRDGSPLTPDEYPALRTLRTGEAISGCEIGVRDPRRKCITWCRASTSLLRQENGGQVVEVVTHLDRIEADTAD